MSRRIVSVSGPPGSGKSSLVAALAEKMGATPVCHDDFEIVSRWPPERVIQWLDEGAPFDAVIAPGLYDHLIALDGLVLLETPFGRACPQVGPLIETAIWLECPLDIALARKLSSLAGLAAPHPDFADFLSGWLDAYQRFTRRALLMQQDRVRSGADLTLSADQSQDKIVSSAFSFLIRHSAP